MKTQLRGRPGMVIMTSIRYDQCDQCGQDSVELGQHLFTVHDINACVIGHLCLVCVCNSLPRIDLEELRRVSVKSAH